MLDQNNAIIAQRPGWCETLRPGRPAEWSGIGVELILHPVYAPEDYAEEQPAVASPPAGLDLPGLTAAAQRWREHQSRIDEAHSPYYAGVFDECDHKLLLLSRDMRILSDAYVAMQPASAAGEVAEMRDRIKVLENADAVWAKTDNHQLELIIKQRDELAALRSQLAAAQAEVERLRGLHKSSVVLVRMKGYDDSFYVSIEGDTARDANDTPYPVADLEIVKPATQRDGGGA